MLLDTSVIVELLKKEAQKEPFFLSMIQLGELAA